MNEDNKKEVVKEKKEENNILKANFFKKVWYSITNIEKYPEMAAQGVGKAISYMMKIVAILAIILCLGIMYEMHGLMQDGINYLQNEFPEFTYKENKLDIASEEAIVITEENSVAGKIIIDTKADSEQKTNQYINEVTQQGQGIIVLKDKLILKSEGVAGTINYEYKEILEQMGITEFTKQDVINYAHSGQIINLYISVFLTLFIYSFIMYLLTTLSNTVFLSMFGYLTTWIAKIRMRYVAVFNMSVYALTLSTILNMIYIAINIFVDFNIEYFQVMYVVVAAIFILKVDLTKKQMELMKIAEAQEIIKKQLEEKEEEQKKENKENKDTESKEAGKDEDKEEKNKVDTENKEVKKEKKEDKKEKKEKQSEDNNPEGEPEGSKA